MRRIAALIIAIALLAGCSPDNKSADGKSPSSATNSVAGTEMPTLNEGDQPTLQFPKSNPPEGLQVKILEEGTGREAAATDVVIANYVGQVWGNPEPFDSSFQRGAPASFSLQQVIAGWTEGLAGLKAGTKVILSIPADKGYGPSGGNEGAGIGENDTIAFYVELLDAFGLEQAGDADATPQADLSGLSVNIDGDLGKPVNISVKDAAKEPKEIVTTIIARGKGEPIGGEGSSVYCQYSLSSWDNSTQNTSYGQAGPQAYPIGGGSLFDSLEGIPVGSRVLVEAPATKANGDQITNPAYAVVIDVLGQMSDAQGKAKK